MSCVKSRKELTVEQRIKKRERDRLRRANLTADQKQDINGKRRLNRQMKKELINELEMKNKQIEALEYQIKQAKLIEQIVSEQKQELVFKNINKPNQQVVNTDSTLNEGIGEFLFSTFRQIDLNKPPVIASRTMDLLCAEFYTELIGQKYY